MSLRLQQKILAPNRNFDGYRFLVGSSLVEVKGFHQAEVAHLVSDFGTSTPSYNIEMFDEILNKYCWPEIEHWKLLSSMSDRANFCDNSYQSAVATYLYWKKGHNQNDRSICRYYCRLTNQWTSSKNPNIKENYRIEIAQYVLNILLTHAASHPIHRALQNL